MTRRVVDSKTLAGADDVVAILEREKKKPAG